MEMNTISNASARTLALFLLSLACFTACSQEETPSLDKLRGLMLDSPVANLEYGNGGRTDSNGYFRYSPEATVEFHLGDVSFGSAKGQDIVTPIDLTPGAFDESSLGVIQRTRFLMSVDADANPDNGIRIPDRLHERAWGMEVDFDSSQTEFEEQANLAMAIFAPVLGETRELVSSTDAQAHLVSSLRNANAGHYGGIWGRDVEVEDEGESEGGEGENDNEGESTTVFEVLGQWEIVMDRSGQITGWALGIEGEQEERLSGTVSTGGSIVFTGNVSNGAFQGNLGSCEMTGTWNDFSSPPGIFEGSCLSESDIFLGEVPEEMFGLYTGSYVGAGSVEKPVAIAPETSGDLTLAEPVGRGTILSLSSSGVADFVIVSIDGTRIAGTIDPDGDMEAIATNSEGEIEFRLVLEGDEDDGEGDEGGSQP